MKRVLFIAALLLAGIQSWSQTMDTLHWYERKPDLYYWGSNWVDSNRMEYPNEILNAWSDITITDDRYYGRACYTPHPMRVIGIAAPVSISYNQYSYFSDRLPEYFQLYQHENDTVIFKAETRWDTATPKLLFEFMENFYGLPNNSAYVPLYEAYFESEKPIIVHDTFYVGGTTHNNLIIGKCEDGNYYFINAHKRTWYWHYLPTFNSTEHTIHPIPAYRMYKYLWPSDCFYYSLADSICVTYDTTQFYFYPTV